MSKRHHPDLFLKWAWKMFRGRFIFASRLLPDRDCIFWENVLADERRAEKQGWVLRSRLCLDRVGPVVCPLDTVRKNNSNQITFRFQVNHALSEVCLCYLVLAIKYSKELILKDLWILFSFLL